MADLTRVEAKIKYLLVGGRVLHRRRFFSRFYLKNIARVDQFVLRASKPAGVFVISKFNKRKGFVLKQIDCRPYYWEFVNGCRRGPDEECKRRCKFYNNCPTHLLNTINKDFIDGRV